MPHSKSFPHPLRILDIDPWLEPYEKDLRLRMDRYDHLRRTLLAGQEGFRAFANGHLYYGFQRSEEGWTYREWAPDAETLHLIGDFNGWNGDTHPLSRNVDGSWELFLPGKDALAHLSRVKVRVRSHGTVHDRIPLYIRKTVQDPTTHDFSGQIWMPDAPFQWTDDGFLNDSTQPLCIYEAHVGMAQEKEAISSYREFADNTLPRIRANGYNTVQLMAIMEHPYYASFGYHVSNFFAASSWFGTPDDLKYLINTAHGLGISVLMDIVHSHAVKNIAEGINEFDGTVHQFFHRGERGNHKDWDSKLFNYDKHEVIHFLLSNIKFWLDEYHFDGFRFDGVTSMCYHDHGMGTSFDSYDKYFSLNTDVEAITYLQFANELIREVRPDAVTIAEDMSGMPGMCLPIADGGIGFDYRLAMGMPDFWIRILEHPDEHWNMHQLWHELTTHRPQEKRIGYVESHDQALVGDKTLIFRLADKEMYWDMAKGRPNLIIDRAIALHKLIRLVTLTLGCDGYLNFMGNEFGHPEWIDFPREGNGWSFAHCKRQWSLADNPSLRYEYLYRFDKDMLAFVEGTGLLQASPQSLWLDDGQKILAFRKCGLIFVFNFHPTNSLTEFQLPTHEHGRYQVVFDTDAAEFGGQDRISHTTVYEANPLPNLPGATGIKLYSPCRTAMVLKKIE